MQSFIVVLWIICHYFAFTKFNLSYDASFVSLSIMLAAQYVSIAIDKRH